MERQMAAAYRQTTPWDGYSDVISFRKLEALRDEEISRSDKKFAEYVKATHASELRDGKDVRLPYDATVQMKYIQQERSRWWTRQYGSIAVVSSEPQLGKSCDIDWLAARGQ